jgi:hypothetical protein
MTEGRGNEAAAIELGDPTTDPPPCDARLPLQIAERVPHSRLVGSHQFTHHIVVGDAEDDRDALRRFERQVEAGDGARRRGRAKLRTGRRITPAQETLDAAFVHLAPETEHPGPGAEPCAGGLALAGVVVLAALRDLLDVVATRRRSRPELAD